MSIEANAVYVYNGSITDLLSGVHKAAESMKLVTGNENVTANAFSLVAANKLGFISTAGPAKFIIKAAVAGGIANLTITADLNMILASQSQVLMNQAKLTEFMDLVKSFAPITPPVIPASMTSKNSPTCAIKASLPHRV